MENNETVNKEGQLVKIDDMSLEEVQVAEQLYYNAGLDPVVEAGIKDYDIKIQQENKLINKVFGIRESDIKGYGESVARRVALAVYGLLNKQYGGKVGDMRSYILSLEDERNRANTRYDDLMGRVIGILGDEYKDLRTDSREFMEKLTKTLGEDLKDSKIDQKALAETLADIDGLRSQIVDLNTEIERIKKEYESKILKIENDNLQRVEELKSEITARDQEKERSQELHESRISALSAEHKKEIGRINLRIVEMDSKIALLESEKSNLTGDLERLTEEHNEFKKSIKALIDSIREEGVGKRLSGTLYKFLLDDSKVPDMVIDGVGKFIDFKKYLGEAAEKGADEVCARFEDLLEEKNPEGPEVNN